MLKLCLPEVKKRGYGLGNEFIPWARAWLMAQALGARCLAPAFGLNRRRYWFEFDTPLDDWMFSRSLVKLFPSHEFTEADYLAHGGADLATAVRGWAAARGLRERGNWLVRTSGLWGGLAHIAPARDFIRATLLGSRHAPRNLQRVRDRCDPGKLLVGMHVRLGDFQAAAAGTDWRTAVNTTLPIEWFTAIASAVQAALPGRVQFLVMSDGAPGRLRPLTDAFPCVTTRDLRHTDCSDLLALAGCDLLACSASTFSALAAFLSDAPYLWYAGNLHRHEAGCLSLGTYERMGPANQKATLDAVASYAGARAEGAGWPTRGHGVGDAGAIDGATLEQALAHRARRLACHELVTAGVMPAP